MKIKLTRPDGTIVEAEGTADECARLIGQPVQPAIPWAPAPLNPLQPNYYPYQPPYPLDFWGGTWCVSTSPTSTAAGQ